jgi:hypothetical protein
LQTSNQSPATCHCGTSTAFFSTVVIIVLLYECFFYLIRMDTRNVMKASGLLLSLRGDRWLGVLCAESEPA